MNTHVLSTPARTRPLAIVGGVTDEELIVEVAVARLDNPGLDLEDVVALVLRRLGEDTVLEFAARTLAVRGELRGAVFEAAAEHVLRVVFTLRGPVD